MLVVDCGAEARDQLVAIFLRVVGKPRIHLLADAGRFCPR